MGVKGLTTFVDSFDPPLFNNYCLHDTKLVIDGNNIYHLLFSRYDVPFEHGGDYDVYSQRCMQFFQTLIDCGIEPVLVFDGAYDADMRKFMISVGRVEEKIVKMSQNTGASQSGAAAETPLIRITPILGQDVFLSVLKRMKIKHVMCDFEADQQIAALANHWNCPVLSNDGDFFVFDVKAGVIALDKMDLHARKHQVLGLQYLEVKMFRCNDFRRLIGLQDHAMLALFATLLGNDTVDFDEFRNFFIRAVHPNNLKARRQDKITLLIEWLQKMHSVDAAVSVVFEYIFSDQRDNVKSLIDRSLAFYTNLVSELHEYFEADRYDVVSSLSLQSGKSLPAWLLRRIRSCDVSDELVTALVNRRVILKCQVEQMRAPSSYDCSLFLRQVAYGMLLSLDVLGGISDGAVVTEYDRDYKKKNIKVKSVKPIWRLNDKPVPDLSHEIDLAARKQVLLDALLGAESDIVEQFPFDIQFLIAIVRYWFLHASPEVTRLHVSALVLCFLKFGALDKFAGLSARDVAKQRLDQFMKSPDDDNANDNINDVHSFAQFQTCLQAAGCITNLLSLEEPVFADMITAFCGTFLFNVSRHWRFRLNADTYVDELLEKSKAAAASYHNLVETICISPPGARSETAPKRTSKKRSSKPHKGFVSAGSRGDSRQTCNSQNKFAALRLLGDE